VQDALAAQAEAVDALTEASENYRKVVEGIREGDKEFVILSDAVVKAEKDLETAVLNLADANQAVKDALIEQEAAQINLTKQKEEYRKIVQGLREDDKEFVILSEAVVKAEETLAGAVRNLADANEAVKDALIEQETAQINLNKQKEEYRKVVEGIREDDKEYIELSEDIVKAEEAQADAVRDLRDALEQAADATDKLRQAEQDLRASRREFRVTTGDAPGRALGGPVTAGRTYTVGEMGPELFVPASSGRIIPNHRMAGGTTVNVVVNAGLGTSGIQVAQQIVDVLNQYTKVSGPLSQYVSV
jgi:chromosome segregation ATPase